MNNLISSVISKNYKKRKLTDVATFERAITGKVYPAGTTIIQISATRGQTIYLDSARTIEPHYVAVIPIDEVEPYYLFIVITKEMPSFCSKHQTGLNIQADAFKHMTIDVHDKDGQSYLATAYRLLEQMEEQEKNTIKALERFKQSMLQKMFV